MQPLMTIENPHSGERVTVLRERPELLELECVWPPGRGRTPEHVHPGMEERWRVVSGSAGFRIAGEECAASAGESVVAAPGVPHVAWNAGEDEAVVRIEMRPALRWRELVERLFAGEPVDQLLREFPRELAPPPR